MPNDYNRKNHTKFSLKVHIILVCKYRKRLLVGEIQATMKHLFHSICEKHHFDIIEMESDRNHIHLLLEYSPTDSVVNIIKILKQQSTYYIWELYNEKLKTEFWEEKTFWSDGYFVCSIGSASEETIRNYIQNQG